MPNFETEPQEVCIWVLVTAITNFATFPILSLLYNRQQDFEFIIGLFTLITSFMYHFCESISSRVYLSIGEWHRLDNIGSIMCFCMFLSLCHLYIYIYIYRSSNLFTNVIVI